MIELSGLFILEVGKLFFFVMENNHQNPDESSDLAEGKGRAKNKTDKHVIFVVVCNCFAVSQDNKELKQSKD